PATKVPWPSSSVIAVLETKLFAAQIADLGNSGCVPSSPESTIATRTGLSDGIVSPNASNAWSCWRYHWYLTSGSVGTKEGRADADGGTSRTIARVAIDVA